MEVVARLRHADISPQKLNLVAKAVRGQSIESAVNQLKFMPKKGAAILLKVIESAMANAEHNHGMDIDELKFSRIVVNQAPNLRRFKARAKGRGTREVKRRSHVDVFLVQAASSEA